MTLSTASNVHMINTHYTKYLKRIIYVLIQGWIHDFQIWGGGGGGGAQKIMCTHMKCLMAEVQGPLKGPWQL